MFKITDFHRAGDKIRMIIETDDPSSALLFQFLSEAQKFADLYHYRLRTASKIDLRQKTRPVRMEQANRFYAEQLTRFRNLEGSRIERFRMLKLLRESDGEKVTLGKIMAEIRIALDNERDSAMKRVQQLSKQGFSIGDTAKKTRLPKSTVSRYLKRVMSANEGDISSVSIVVLPLRKE